MEQTKATLILYKNENSSGEMLIKHSHPRHLDIERKLIRSLSNKKRKFQYDIETTIVTLIEDDDKTEVIFND